MSYIYIPEISSEPYWVSDEIPEGAVFSYGFKGGYDPLIHTPETHKKHAERMKGNQYRKGKKQTEYQKKRTSEVHSGRIVSKETRKKMGASQKKRIRTEEEKQKISLGLKKYYEKKRNE